VVGIERRTLPGDTAGDVERELAGILDACRAQDRSLVVRQRTLLVRQPFEIDPGAEVVRALGSAFAETTGSPPAIGGASYWADSAFLAAAGIPTVLFGPGGEGAHASEEWVSLRDTATVAGTLATMAARFCA
jgi:acetylornithine deacetylase